ncbi:MAG TPA: ATP-binding protein [Blastocatellia bacterium]|nr:ATP-binding protein [Blastocatellia bacterium]
MNLWQTISSLKRTRPTSASDSVGHSDSDFAVQADASDPLITSLLAGVDEAVLVIDPDSQVKAYNDQALELFGLHDLSDPIRLSTVTRDQIIHTLVKQTLHNGVQHEERVQTVIGSERTLQVRATPIFDPDQGKVLGVVACIRDLSHIEHLERVRREFFANLSHDIRTPLTSILAYVETLLDGALSDSQNNVRFLEIIHRNASRLSILINDYSNLSLIESGGLKLHIEEVSLAQLIDELKVMFHSQLENNQIELRINIPEDFNVYADPQRLVQILTNLLDNAIKFNKPGGKIFIEAETKSYYSVIVVRDTGSGITPQDLPRIFERLYRADKSRTPGVGGSGLGLAIVKHLAQAHGGEVEVESVPNLGSTFRVKLPIVGIETAGS